MGGLVFTVLYFSCGICKCDWFEGQRHFILALLALCSLHLQLQLIRLCATVQQFQELQLNLPKAAFSFICIHSVDLRNARLSLKKRYANLFWARLVCFTFTFFFILGLAQAYTHCGILPGNHTRRMTMKKRKKKKRKIWLKGYTTSSRFVSLSVQLFLRAVYLITLFLLLSLLAAELRSAKREQMNETEATIWYRQ